MHCVNRERNSHRAPGETIPILREAGDDVALRWTRAMQRGDFEAAWRETDRIELPRRECEAACRGTFVRHPFHLLWNGEPFDGRDVVVRCNHGLGDTLQFLRFVPGIAQRAASVTTLVQPPLVDLLRRTRGLGHLLDGWAELPLPSGRVEVEVMELAHACRTTLRTLPSPLDIGLDRLHVRGHALAPHMSCQRRRVGLLWSASDWDVTRSIPLAALAPLGNLYDVEFFSLQQGRASNDLCEAPFDVRPLHRHTRDVADAAAAMLALDLVITVDAMATHLAGTLRRPVWLLLKHDADWRWMTERVESAWYPTMRLFRQPEPGNWHAVADALAHALSELPQRSP
jgi:hypothetical protein